MDELVAELKREGVLKSRYVEAAFRAVDRADFVPPELKDQAYANHPLPIGGGQTISQPYTVAFMLDLLDPRPGEKILDIGAGSGWQTALLAQVVSGVEGRKTKAEGNVYAVERIPELFALARANIAKYNFLKSGVVAIRCGDASAGIQGAGPFDKIVAAASADARVPDAWRNALRPGGVLVAPVGSSIWRYEKRLNGTWEETEFPGFAFVPLIKSDQGNKEAERAKKTRSKKISGLMLLAILVFFAPVRAPGDRAAIEIPTGSGSRAIGELLRDSGLVRSKWAFVTYATLSGSAGSLRPGGYEFSGLVTIPEILRAVTRGGREADEVVITIHEGWDLRDIAAYFEELGLTSRQDLWRITGEPASGIAKSKAFPPAGAFAEVYSFLQEKPPGASLEGWLYPDTYRVRRKAPIEQAIEKMAANFERRLTPDVRALIAASGKSVNEILTMASIIEKEVAVESDRRVVSGILWKRLALGIPLQVDASVSYAVGRRGTPSAAELAVNSPYNTYRIRGLPPSPISNPGLDAIRAALAPAPSEYLYYLSARDGLTIFSKTLPEHAAAKARHLGR